MNTANTTLKRFKLGFLLGFYLSFFASSIELFAWPLTILHTNDHHGRFWPNEKGEGGLPARASYIKSVREEVQKQGGQVLLLDAGDINTGIPHSDSLEALPDFMGYQKLQYDAVAIGNHEFDNPPEILEKQQAWLETVPLLSANIFYKKTSLRPFRPYISKWVNDVKVAIIGVTTTSTPFISNPRNSEHYEFRSPVEVLKQLVPKLKEEGHKLIFVVSHVGLEEENNPALSFEGERILAKQVVGIDAIIGGHTHTLYQGSIEPNTQTVISQAASWGKYVGRLNFDVEVQKENKEIKVKFLGSEMIPINLKQKNKEGKLTLVGSKEWPQEEEMTVFLKPFYEEAEKVLNIPVGNSLDIFPFETVRKEETAFGKVASNAQRDKVKADLAIVNSGSIRDSLPQGTISYAALYKIQPFGNTICTVKMTGKELWNYIEEVIKVTWAVGKSVQLSSDVFVEVNSKTFAVESLKIKGKKIKKNETKNLYTLAVNNFLAVGGDKFPKLTQHPRFLDTGFVDHQSLKEFVEEKKTLDPKTSEFTQRSFYFK